MEQVDETWQCLSGGNMDQIIMIVSIVDVALLIIFGSVATIRKWSVTQGTHDHHTERNGRE